MTAYEFSTQWTNSEAVIVPHEYARKLQKGASMRVILLVEEQVQPEEVVKEAPEGILSLEEVVACTQRLEPNPNYITPASGLLAQHLMELENEVDLSFDINSWLGEWTRFEAQMEADELAHEALEWSTQAA